VATNIQTPPHDGADVVSVVTHLVEEMYEHLDTLNSDIDRLTTMRDRMKAAILALAPPGDTLPTESARPGIKESAAVTPPAPAKRKQPTFATSKGTSAKREPKYDLAAVAEVARNAHLDGRPMGRAVATVLDVTEAMGGWLIREARKAGHAIPQRGDSRDAPITPAEIRHEVEPVPETSRLAEREFTQPIPHATGFVGRPTTVEHAPPRADAWTPDRARDAIEAVAS